MTEPTCSAMRGDCRERFRALEEQARHAADANHARETEHAAQMASVRDSIESLADRYDRGANKMWDAVNAMRVDLGRVTDQSARVAALEQQVASLREHRSGLSAIGRLGPLAWAVLVAAISAAFAAGKFVGG